MSAETQKPSLPFGALLGVAPGNVPAYSSDYDNIESSLMPDRSSYRHYIDGVYTGYKWQCVEFARRWLLLNKGYVFDDIAMAYDIFRLEDVRVVKDKTMLPIHAFANGSKRHPVPGCMLIWDEGGEFRVTGHVAIVTEVFPDKIRVAEQNVEHHSWDGNNYSRELAATIAEDGSYWVRCTFRDAIILGWVMQTDDAIDAEHPEEPDKRLFGLEMAEMPDEGQHLKPWLNLANPDEAAYVESMKGHRLSSVEGEDYKYLRMSNSAYRELRRATNELHSMFMHATHFVMQNDHLLKNFNIPEAIWPRIHQSWDNRRNQMITGRFDFCMTERGIKIYEYNADSASCHMECGKVQGLWARHFDCDDGWDPGSRLHKALVDAWQDSEVDGVVHIMQDRDMEETYHALFMKEAMDEAGVDSKIIRGLDGLAWNDAGDVVDEDGLPIKWVWKTWAWETALDQLREELDQAGDIDSIPPSQRPAPRLMDVLFRPDVMVFEPLWTLVTSNKALLPIMWQMFPEYLYLLNSSFELTDALQHSGYVSKPIAGRCGYNISMVDKRHEVITETGGQFGKQENIYQELCRLPKIDGYNVQLCTFSVAGHYAGSCVRLDKDPIITTDSDLLPLRVVSDREFISEME